MNSQLKKLLIKLDIKTLKKCIEKSGYVQEPYFDKEHIISSIVLANIPELNKMKFDNMKKIIAVSVYGTNPRYFEGAIENAKISKSMFPGWIYKVYLGSKAPTGFKTRLLNEGNTEVIDVDEFFTTTPTIFGPGVFWRFLEMFNDENQIMICRDSDTRLIERDWKCVNEWIDSYKKFKDNYNFYFWG